jgi:F-type H+-transporting ATPase subunit b
VVTGGAVASVVLLGSEGTAFAKEKPTDVSKCVENAVKTGQQADSCLKAPNPIVPSASELVWGSISFVVLFYLLWKFAFPAVKKGMDARTERIRESLDDAEKAKTDAQGILEEYQRQLADARNEAARIIEEARQTADAMRQDLMRRAEEEAAAVRQRAEDDIRASTDRALADLQARVATLSIELAEKVVERNLDHDTQMQLIENYINEVGAQRA